MTQAYDPMLLQRAGQIRLLALDVDGVLTDGRLYFTDDGQELKSFHSQDGLGLKALMQYGVEVALITARRSRLLERRSEQLTIKHVYQGQEDKLTAYRELRGKLDLDNSQVCYMGDDWIDLPVLIRAGLAVSVPNGHPEVVQRVHWVTQKAGGLGAVREVCDLILHAQGHGQHWLEQLLDR